MMIDAVLLLGRALLSAIFIWGGWGKLMAATATQAYFGKVGLPVPELAYAVAVFMELGVGLALLAGLFTRLSAFGLAVWCIATALVAHADFGDRAMQIQFMKNVAMSGGMLYAAAVGGGAYSVDAVIRRRRTTALA